MPSENSETKFGDLGCFGILVLIGLNVALAFSLAFFGRIKGTSKLGALGGLIAYSAILPFLWFILVRFTLCIALVTRRKRYAPEVCVAYRRHLREALGCRHVIWLGVLGTILALSLHLLQRVQAFVFLWMAVTTSGVFVLVLFSGVLKVLGTLQELFAPLRWRTRFNDEGVLDAGFWRWSGAQLLKHARLLDSLAESIGLRRIGSFVSDESRPTWHSAADALATFDGLLEHCGTHPSVHAARTDIEPLRDKLRLAIDNDVRFCLRVWPLDDVRRFHLDDVAVLVHRRKRYSPEAYARYRRHLRQTLRVGVRWFSALGTISTLYMLLWEVFVFVFIRDSREQFLAIEIASVRALGAVFLIMFILAITTCVLVAILLHVAGRLLDLASPNLMPYFSAKVPGNGLGIGYELLKHSRLLDSLAESIGLRRIGSFISDDDFFDGSGPTWHSAADALATFDGLLEHCGTHPSVQAARTDIEHMRDRLRLAIDNDVQFCLLLRDVHVTNASEWGQRKGHP